MGNVILLTTMWGNPPPSEDGEMRVADLTGKGELLGQPMRDITTPSPMPHRIVNESLVFQA